MGSVARGPPPHCCIDRAGAVHHVRPLIHHLRRHPAPQDTRTLRGRRRDQGQLSRHQPGPPRASRHHRVALRLVHRRRCRVWDPGGGGGAAHGRHRLSSPRGRDARDDDTEYRRHVRRRRDAHPHRCHRRACERRVLSSAQRRRNDFRATQTNHHHVRRNATRHHRHLDADADGRDDDALLRQVTIVDRGSLHPAVCPVRRACVHRSLPRDRSVVGTGVPVARGCLGRAHRGDVRSQARISHSQRHLGLRGIERRAKRWGERHEHQRIVHCHSVGTLRAARPVLGVDQATAIADWRMAAIPQDQLAEYIRHRYHRQHHAALSARNDPGRRCRHHLGLASHESPADHRGHQGSESNPAWCRVRVVVHGPHGASVHQLGNEPFPLRRRRAVAVDAHRHGDMGSRTRRQHMAVVRADDRRTRSVHCRQQHCEQPDVQPLPARRGNPARH